MAVFAVQVAFLKKCRI